MKIRVRKEMDIHFNDDDIRILCNILYVVNNYLEKCSEKEKERMHWVKEIEIMSSILYEELGRNNTEICQPS